MNEIKIILLKLCLQDSEVVRSARHLLSLLTSGSTAGPSQENARFFCVFFIALRIVCEKIKLRYINKFVHAWLC